jgi:hypothetical protein
VLRKLQVLVTGTVFRTRLAEILDIFVYIYLYLTAHDVVRIAVTSQRPIGSHVFLNQGVWMNKTTGGGGTTIRSCP